MIIFAIIIFSLATIRTITPFSSSKPYENGSAFIGHLLVAITMIWCYIWFLGQYIKLK